MGEKRIDKMHEGIILVRKPSGLTSHDVVDIVRRKLHTRRVGHAGTLDPLAEGLLIMLVGRYTKLFSKFSDLNKEYMAVLKLGEATDTGDAQGKITRRMPAQQFTPEAISKVVETFKGEIEQIPPMVSALRKGGERLYRLARRGIEVERKPRKITIYELDILDINLPFVELRIKCSKGTYIRKLAEDIGEKLGTCAHIIKIKRTGIGPFKLREASEVDQINESSLKAALL